MLKCDLSPERAVLLTTFSSRSRLVCPNKGRVLLLDLTQDPHTIRQFKSDLGPLFPGNSDLAENDLRAEVTKLAADHDEVKTFLKEMGKAKDYAR